MQQKKKNQLPQIIALSVLTCGMFGYFTYRMILPTPAAAHSRVTALTATKRTLIVAAATDTAGVAPDLENTPPPSPTMHDPFAPGIDTSSAASAPTAGRQRGGGRRTLEAAQTFPSVDPLPPPSGRVPLVPPLPGSTLPGISPQGGRSAQPGVGNWTVTGVLGSGDSRLAVMRNGEERRIARPGDLVDSRYRIVSVSRNGVILRHGDDQVILPLGGSKPAPKEIKPASEPASQIAQPAATETPALSNNDRASGTGATNAGINQ